MKVFGLMGLLAIALLMVSAEEKMPDGFQQWTGASLKDIELTLKTEADASSHHMSVRRLADFPRDTFMLSRRQADGVVEWHENQADVFFVQSGSATLLVGGSMVGGEVTEPHESATEPFKAAPSANCRLAMSFAFLRKCPISSCSMVRLNSPTSSSK